MKLKNKNRQLGVTLSLLLNFAFYAIAIFMTLFIVSFEVEKLLPRWEVFIPFEEAGKYFWQQGYTEIVPKGTAGAYFVPGVLVVSGVVNLLGFLLFMNSRYGRKLKLTLEDVYLRNIKTIDKFGYLISDDVFAGELFAIDQKNKSDAWSTKRALDLQKHMDKIPKKVEKELFLESEFKSKRTLKWIEKRDKIRESMTKEWIKENLHLIRIKYPRINARMIVTGVDSVKVSRMAITDVREIERRETMQKVLTMLIMFVIVSIFTALTFPSFRQDIWMVVKDYIVYTTSLVTNIIMGGVSAHLIHKARIRETEDRKGYIRDYVGAGEFEKKEQEAIDEMNSDQINDLENKLFKLRQIKKLEEEQTKKEP